MYKHSCGPKTDVAPMRLGCQVLQTAKVRHTIHDIASRTRMAVVTLLNDQGASKCSFADVIHYGHR